MVDQDEIQQAEELQRILVLILRTAQGHHTHKLQRDSKEQRAAVKMAAGFTAKYGVEWKVLVKRILDNWTHPMNHEAKKDQSPDVEECLSQQLVNKGTRYVWGVMISEDIIPSNPNEESFSASLNSLLDFCYQELRRKG